MKIIFTPTQYTIGFLLAGVLTAPLATAQIQYPVTNKVTQVDILHGESVADPYRSFENDTTAEVKAWVKAQNAVTFDNLEKIPFRKQLRQRIGDLKNFISYSQPTRVGEYYLFSKNSGKKLQAVLYVQKGLKGTPSVFIDSNKLSADGTIQVRRFGSSKDGRYIALST